MNDKMQWFRDAKLGIFMHWGIYSVLGVTESWSFFDGSISYEDYMNQLSGFTAENYNPEKWAQLFEKTGAKYTVLTSKHHDGVALWDTKASDLNVCKKTPAKRDLIAPYADAMRAHNIKVGLYFSHLDWSHPDYAAIHPKSNEWWASSKFTAPPENMPDDYEKWERFLKFHKAQLTELLSNYGKIDLLWFDGVWERTEEQWKFKEMNDYIRSLAPEIIINGRIGKYGDYKTPEQALPTVPPEGDWEFCTTLNDSWGYNPKDTNYKSPRQLIRILTECIGMGGNLLLDIGPKPDGTIDEKAEALLLELGAWVHKYPEAVYATKRGLPQGFFFGNSALSKDEKTLYLYYYDSPMGELAVKGIRNDIKRISVLGKNTDLPHYKQGGFLDMPGVLWFSLPKELCDSYCTVIKIEFNEPIDIYTGAGGGIK